MGPWIPDLKPPHKRGVCRAACARALGFWAAAGGFFAGQKGLFPGPGFWPGFYPGAARNAIPIFIY